MERTLVLLKPDCVQRRLMGRIIARLEDKGFSIVALKMLHMTPEMTREHYAEHVEQSFYPRLERFTTAGPVVAMVVQGLQAIRVVRDMLGVTSGWKAKPGTIRGDFGLSQQMNLMHASDGPQAAKREIDLFFTAEEICDFESCLSRWTKAEHE
jgi:nucleoside-diphosphate kinase